MDKAYDKEYRLVEKAIWNNDLQCATFLSHKFPSLKDKDKDTLLVYACELGSRLWFIGLLLENGANIEGKSNGITPLIAACCSGRMDSIKYLIGKKAAVNGLSSYGHTAISATCTSRLDLHQKLEVIDFLIHHGADINAKGGAEYPIFSAIKLSVALVRALLERGASTLVRTTSGRTVLHCACYGDSLEMIKLFCTSTLINCQDYYEFTPLHIACTHGNLAAIELLLQQDPDLQQGLVLDLSYMQPNTVQIAQLLFEKMTSIQPHLLAKAVYFANFAVAHLILDSFPQLNYEAQYQGHTALYYACNSNNAPLVEILLKKGADANSSGANIPPIFISSYQQDPQVFDLLIAYKANVNVSTTSKNAACTVKKYLIHRVMESNCAYYVKKVLKAGAILEDFVETVDGKENRMSIWKFAKYNCLPEIRECISVPHTPETHKQFPQYIRIAVITFMLANHRNRWNLDNSIVHKIFSYEWG